MAKKVTEKIVELLIQKGCEELPFNSRKYRKFTRPNVANSFYFVGKGGSVRSGRTVSKSYSLTRSFRKEVKLNG